MKTIWNRIRHLKTISKGNVKVIGWGTGSTYQKSKHHPIPLSYLIDGNGGGKELNGLSVYSPEKLLEEDPNNTVIIVFSMFYEEIRKKIDEYGGFTSIAFKSMF